MSEEKLAKLSIKYLEQSVKYQEKLHEVIELKQQILDAENVIRELQIDMGGGYSVADKYWEKYDKE